ncbi:hypothetical protein JoomaDRAFT_1466 [Galbibacter orientalis DSM 19592]|uniref:Glycosyl-4,4'-diaponeurosporenoate acyltransferase n=1 Tax=Galbibacter orientalis DSM 19592 TaxID=926559 RepID=I3C4D8_9FLAO|nr:hypothetical protein [Galbibacter orientalis]EIJ38481.1 hypothetical protein JoomaDRAFT_1466 [Galbibacter orientalis DSM 19592]
MIKYLVFGISISFISWIVGMLFNSILVKTEFYKKISNFNFIESETLNNNIGLSYFKWIVKNTLFKFFNQKITLKNKKMNLREVRKEMTIAEISHLIAFIFVSIIAIYKGFTQSFLLGLIIMLVNLLMNLYPSLLQQENKRRIDKLIKKQVKPMASTGSFVLVLITFSFSSFY